MSELEDLSHHIRGCTDCALSRSRANAVPGEGPQRPLVMFIGEAPGAQEDRQGRPFVGPAGQLLERLLAQIGLDREQVYITNTVKCRPPNNRDPFPGEIGACRKYLERQLQLLQPKVVVTLGRHSLGHFLPKETISHARGKPRQEDGFTVYPTYHPAAALHQQSLQRVIEQDFAVIPSLLQQPAPSAIPPEVKQQLPLL